MSESERAQQALISWVEKYQQDLTNEQLYELLQAQAHELWKQEDPWITEDML